MAKISPISIKYMIYAEFEASGALEKPDVIGAIFGQTEGLLGSDLEMRDLQKEGKIGRIEVELKTENSKTIGKIEIPSALDKTETTLIAAAMETIERIGPSTAKIKIEKIEDVRKNKREYILGRAKKLLEGIEENMPKTREITRTIKEESREERVREYGAEKLPAGNIESGEIIVVEGRADVLNLLRNNVENVIGMDGTKLPETIKELSYDKEITLFIDGDRGGKLIAKNVVDNARIDFIAVAPDGKEVEELSGKEILSALRKKIPAQEFFRGRGRMREERREEQEEEKEESEEEAIDLTGKMPELKKLLEEVKDTKYALFLNRNLEIIDRVGVRNIFLRLKDRRRDVEVIVIDKATPVIINSAEECRVKSIVARNFSFSGETKVNLVSL